MNYHNMTAAELKREAESTDNALALALAESMEAQAEEREEQLTEEREELIAYHHSEVLVRLEGFNQDYRLDPDSDESTTIAEMLDDEITEDDLRRVIGEIEESGIYLSEERTEYLTSLDDAALDELLDRLMFESDRATEVAISRHPFTSVPLSLACHALGEVEEDLEHWMQEVPESLHKEVMDSITGTDGGTLYYLNNSNYSLDLKLSIEWLADWLDAHMEQDHDV